MNPLCCIVIAHQQHCLLLYHASSTSEPVTAETSDMYYPPSETQSDVNVYTAFVQKTCGDVLRLTYCTLLSTTFSA